MNGVQSALALGIALIRKLHARLQEPCLIEKRRRHWPGRIRSRRTNSKKVSASAPSPDSPRYLAAPGERALASHCRIRSAHQISHFNFKRFRRILGAPERKAARLDFFSIFHPTSGRQVLSSSDTLLPGPLPTLFPFQIHPLTMVEATCHKVWSVAARWTIFQAL